MALAADRVAAATVVLVALVVSLGPALSVIPIETLRLVVGALLLGFGPAGES